MSLDVAVIPARFRYADEALEICDAMFGDPGGDPPASVREFVDELDRMGAIAEQSGFLAMWPVDACDLGAILCIGSHVWSSALYTLLGMAKRSGLALVDLQLRQVFDPRGSVDIDVRTANRTRLPYLTGRIMHDVMDNQDYYGDHVIVKRDDQSFIQALYPPGAHRQVVEYRAGRPDQHFQTAFADRALVPRLIAAWIQHGPAAELIRAQHWQRMQFT